MRDIASSMISTLIDSRDELSHSQESVYASNELLL